MAEEPLEITQNTANTQASLEPQASSNRRIAQNALMLYVRMFLTMIVGLYTSRVVLATLGVEDYGIYGVVGGVVGMLGFLNASMSGATSRFLNFAMGKGDKKEVAKTFSTALIIHIGIAILILILAETVGLWFLNKKLIIPANRMYAAQYIYHLSVASAMLEITQAPYGATIISHEKMGVFAYFTLLNVFLKLGIVFLLTIGDFDKLIFYGWLTFFVSVFMRILYRMYCIRHFEEARFHWVWEKRRFKELLSFSALNLFGNFGSILSNQGTTIVINRFFGVAMNAAASIGLTIANTVNLFAANLMTAFRPQIVQTYAQGDFSRFQELTIMAIKIILLVYSFVAIPTFIQTDYLLDLWLVKPPSHSSLFCRIMLISIFFETLRYILIINIHATGKVKFVSLSTGILLCLTPFITYTFYKFGVMPEFAFVSFIIAHIILSIINLLLVNHYISQVDIKAYCNAILQVIIISISVYFITYCISKLLSTSFLNLSVTVISSSILLTGLAFSACLNKAQRQYARQLLKSRMHFYEKHPSS